MTTNLAGQWLSEPEAGADVVVLDLDDGPEFATGTGRIFFANGSPGTIVAISIPKASKREIVENCKLSWMPPGNASVANIEQIKELFPDYSFPETATIKISLRSNKLQLSWKTDIGTEGKSRLVRSNPSASSRIEAESISWDEFKTFALRQTARSFIFRGQPATYKMRTAFHRTYRKDLVKYVGEDIPVAHKQLTAITKHLFNLESGLERGAFWNLLQHHGYPTPLLDWTFSPFVAAFFAYRRRKVHEDKDRSVRIVAFDRMAWSRDFNQLEVINFARPHFSAIVYLTKKAQIRNGAGTGRRYC